MTFSVQYLVFGALSSYKCLTFSFIVAMTVAVALYSNCTMLYPYCDDVHMCSGGICHYEACCITKVSIQSVQQPWT